MAAAMTSVDRTKSSILEFARDKQPNKISASPSAPTKSHAFLCSGFSDGKPRYRTTPTIEATPTARITRMEMTYDQPVTRASHVGTPTSMNQMAEARNKTTAIKTPSHRFRQASRMTAPASNGARKRKPPASQTFPSDGG